MTARGTFVWVAGLPVALFLGAVVGFQLDTRMNGNEGSYGVLAGGTLALAAYLGAGVLAFLRRFVRRRREKPERR